MPQPTHSIEIARLTAALMPGGDGGGAPEWVRLMPAGTVTPGDGRGPWRVEDLSALIAASIAGVAGGVLPIDYDHQSETAGRDGRTAPAAGWIVALEARADGIWGQVEWTTAGRASVTAREYRFLSPTFTVDRKSGRVAQLLRAALTNVPAIRELQIASRHHHHHQEPDMPDVKALAVALGLADDADPDAVITAATAAVTANKEAATRAGVSQGGAPDPALYVPREAHDALAQEVATMRSESAMREATRAVEAASAAGKVAPALRDWAIQYASADPAGFAGWVDKAPVIVAPNGNGNGGGGGGSGAGGGRRIETASADGLTDDERVTCRALDITPEKFIATRDGMRREGRAG